MRNIDAVKLFKKLCGVENEFLKYIIRTQGEAWAPINFYEAAVSLGLNKDDVRRACKRLVDANVLLADGENFQVNEEIFQVK